MEQRICQCCGMPLSKEIMAKNKDGSINKDYCQWCLVDGEFTYKDMDELVDACIPHLIERGLREEDARAHMRALIPNLDYWRKS